MPADPVDGAQEIERARREYATAGNHACREQPCPYTDYDDTPCDWCFEDERAFSALVTAILKHHPAVKGLFESAAYLKNWAAPPSFPGYARDEFNTAYNDLGAALAAFRLAIGEEQG